jgi:hypothetical protein
MTVDRRVVPFKRWHYEWLANAGQAVDQRTRISDYTLAQLEQFNSWTGVMDGSPVLCAGTIQQWPGRHIAWAYLNESTGRQMLRITNEVKRKLLEVKGRIEFTVRADFPAGHRWAKLIGFEVETPLLKAYGPEGEDHVGYVRHVR